MSATETYQLAPDEGAEEPGKRRWPLVLLVVMLLLAASAASWWWFVEREAPEVTDGEVVVLEPLTTTTGNATLRHARISLGIVLTDRAEPGDVRPQVALLQDELLRLVAEMDGDQLRGPQGSAMLRGSLTETAHELWGEDVVRRVVLTELLVQ